MSDTSHLDFHEVWWIYSPPRHPWGGLRIAHFRKAANNVEIVTITGEIDPKRVGVRVWNDITETEGWVKVQRIPIPHLSDVASAVDAKLTEIAADVTREAVEEMEQSYAVSCSGLVITVECDDHDTKDKLFDFIERGPQ